MEPEWSDGVLEYWSVGVLHYSSTPLLRLIPPASSLVYPYDFAVAAQSPNCIKTRTRDGIGGLLGLRAAQAVLAKLRSRAHSLCTSQTCKRGSGSWLKTETSTQSSRN